MTWTDPQIPHLGRDVIPDEIRRDPDGAARTDHDLIVIGGGIQGVTTALEATRRGLRPLLLEREDYGHATSGSSLRILHGGLRYLQGLELPRLFASVAERRWFARHFPELVRPLPCMMPLYGRGLRRRSVMRVALAINDVLSVRRNAGVEEPCRLPRGRVLGVAETTSHFPGVERDGLEGSALWYDLIMPSSERMLIEILRWAIAHGATALNYTEAVRLSSVSGRIAGVEARDLESGTRFEFRAPVVVNCAGPWAGDAAAELDEAFDHSLPLTLAFNLLLDREPVSDIAVAVEPPDGGHTYFLLPWHGRTMTGTCYSSREKAARTPTPTAAEVGEMLRDIGEAIGQRLQPEDVLRVFPGLLPAKRPGADVPKRKDQLVDHAKRGGTRGLYSVLGVKYTTARRLAEKAIRMAYGSRKPRARFSRGQSASSRSARASEPGAWMRDIAREESVLHLDDLLLRRLYWDGDDATPVTALEVLTDLYGWDEARQQLEMQRVQASMGRTLPGDRRRSECTDP